MARIIDKYLFVTEKEAFISKISKKNFSPFSWKYIPSIFFNLRLKFIEFLFWKGIHKAKKKGLVVTCHYGNNFAISSDKLNRKFDLVLLPSEYNCSDNMLSLTSRDFSSPTYRFLQNYKEHEDRLFDFVIISNLSKNKRVFEVFKTIEKSINDKTWSGKGCIVCPTHFNENSKSHHGHLSQHYLISSQKVRNSISLIRLSVDLGFQGIQGPALPFIMSNSRNLILASFSEGEPRVMQEALLSKTNIIISKDLQCSIPTGAENHIKKFSTISEIPKILIEMRNKKTFKNQIFHDEATSMDILIRKLTDISGNKSDYKKLHNIVKENEGFDRILPGHSYEKESWFIGLGGYPGNEIKTLLGAYKFYRSI